MRTSGSILTALAVALGLLAGTSTPASAADDTGTTRAGNGILFECADHPYRYNLSLPWWAESWSLDLDVTGPDGLNAASDFLYDEPSTSGTAGFQLCSMDEPGRYTITGKVEYHDSDYNSFSFNLTPSTFTMRQPKTRTTIKANSTRIKAGKTVRFTVTSSEERPRAYYPGQYDTVVLQALTKGKWRRVAKGMTDERGRVVLRSRIAKKVKLRAVTPGTSTHSTSTSRPVTVRTR